MKMKKSSLILVTLILLLSCSKTFSQTVGKRISHTTTIIFNNSENNLKFKLGKDTSSLLSYDIKANEKWISPTFPPGSKLAFYIKTREKELGYTLRLNTTYLLFWNSDKGYWDLKKMTNLH